MESNTTERILSRGRVQQVVTLFANEDASFSALNNVSIDYLIIDQVKVDGFAPVQNISSFSQLQISFICNFLIISIIFKEFIERVSLFYYRL